VEEGRVGLKVKKPAADGISLRSAVPRKAGRVFHVGMQQETSLEEGGDDTIPRKGKDDLWAGKSVGSATSFRRLLARGTQKESSIEESFLQSAVGNAEECLGVEREID